MRIADKWEDYDLYDCANEYRLERWGKYCVARPDPQIVWKNGTKDFARELRDMDAIYYRSDKGGGHWEKKEGMPENWKIHYRDLTFLVKPTNFKHMGVFPEQAVNWDLCRELIKNAGREIRVLNLFAYTGGATLACAAAGAQVCHVDAIKGVVTWAKENARLSGLADKPIRWIVDDAMKFINRELRRGNRYDAIILDPPSYGRGTNGEVWKIEDCINDLLLTCSGLLTKEPLFVMLNSYTTGLSPTIMGYLLDQSLGLCRKRTMISEEIGLPVSSFKFDLPCGSTSIAVFE